MKSFDHLTDSERELIARASLGMRMEEFLNRDEGRYIYGCAVDELIEIRNQLESVVAAEPLQVIQLQERARQIRNVLEWIRDAIEDGEQAQREVDAIS